MDFLDDDGISERIKLKLLDEQSVRGLREALIELLPEQSAARRSLADIEAQAETLRAAQRDRKAGRK